VRSPVRRGEEDDSWDALRNPRHGGCHNRSGRNPDQEHRVQIVQRPVESGRCREVPAHHLDCGRQTGGIRVANQGPDADIRGEQLRNHLAPDVTRRPDDEDSFHTISA